jgi:hypothetical protein
MLKKFKESRVETKDSVTEAKVSEGTTGYIPTLMGTTTSTDNAGTWTTGWTTGSAQGFLYPTAPTTLMVTLKESEYEKIADLVVMRLMRVMKEEELKQQIQYAAEHSNLDERNV